MRSQLKQWIVYGATVVVVVVVSPAVFLVLHGACSSSGPTARNDPNRPEKTITVTLKNNEPAGGERVHILASGQSRPDNGLDPQGTTTTQVIVAVNDVERFRAENNLRGEIDAQSCGPVSEAAYDRGTGFRVEYLNDNLVCIGWR